MLRQLTSKKLIVTLIAVIILMSIFYIPMKIAIEEESPAKTLRSIFMLSISNDEVVKVSESDLVVKYISKFKYGNRPIVDFMESTGGWTFTDQMGSGYVFEGDRKTTTVGGRIYMKRYIVWSIPKVNHQLQSP